MNATARILLITRKPQSAGTLQTMLGLKDRSHFLRRYIQPLVDAGLLESTLPGKPTSSQQAYRLTAAGDQWLDENLRNLPPP